MLQNDSISEGVLLAKPGKVGCKRLSESRANEIRMRLIAWEEVPEGTRQSLRQLATELGTSHQLLSFYLRGLGTWKSKAHRRQADAICERAAVEGRPMTNYELYLERAHREEAARCNAVSILNEMYRLDEVNARRGRLPREYLDGLIKLGDPRAVKIAQIMQKQEQKLGTRLFAILQQLNQIRDTDKYQRLFNSLPSQDRKKLAALSGNQKTGKNNLPPSTARARKSFKPVRRVTGNSAKRSVHACS